MKVVNDSLKNSLKNPTTQRKGRILVGENYYEVYNVKYYADAYNEGNVIGNAISSQLDFEMPYIEKFNTFKYFDGVWNGSSYEYVDFGTFTVFDEKDEDDFNKHITAFDNLIKFNIPFNDVGGYPKTLFQELQNVCSQAGVQLLNTTILNGNFIVDNNQFVNGESLKTVLKQICSISGNYAIIKDDMLVLQLKNNSNEIIDKSQHEPVDWKRRTYGINQVIIGISNVEGEYVIRQDEQDIAQNGVHKLVINDNLFAYTQSKRDELIDELFQQVRGFGYLPYEMSCEWLNYLEIGDTITIDNIETIVLRIEGSSPKSLESKISAPAIIDSSIEYLDNTNDVKNQLKRTEIIVDKNNQSVQSVIEQTEEQNQKIAQVTQTVEELNSKISDIADITISAEDTDAKIELNEINQSEPIRLVVRPIGESISNLVVSSNMLISDNLKLKQRVIRFTNTNTNEVFDYSLPDDLFYYDSENYDEFILDYDGQSCVINKKVGLNKDGTVYLLETPTTIEYEFPTGDKAIILTEGNYTVEILGYGTGYIFARLMAKNIYTTQFYTKAEVDSEISQTAQDIELSVNQKLSNYSTTTEMNSAITLKANEITSSVSSTYATKNELSTAKSEIKQTTDSITSTVSTKVGNNEVISKINQSAEQITINANKLNLNGYLTISNANNTYATQSNLQATNNNLANNYSSNTQLATSGSTIINGGNIITGTIDAEKLKVTTLSSISSNLGSITGGSININNYFSVNSSGGAQISTSGGGFFTTRTTTHPYVSALNVAFGSTGINFYSGTTQDSIGSKLGHIYGSSSGNVVIEGNNGTWIQDIHITDGIQINGNSEAYIRLNYSVVLKPNPNGGAYIWGTEDYNKILTVGGSPSTLSIKENVRLKDTSDIPKLLSQIELYDYNYIDEVENGKDDYGYIIDYLEKIEGIDKYFKFNDIKRNELKYKTINHEHLQKFLLGAVIELQKQINELRGENL